MDDDAADVLIIHPIFVALVNFVQGDRPGSARFAQHCGTVFIGASGIGSLPAVRAASIVISHMTSLCAAVRILDFISRASRRAKCHISSSVSREKLL